MPDDRSVEEKLNALLADNSGATDGERAAVRAALLRLHRVPAARTESHRVITRADAFASPDRKTARRTKTILVKGVSVTYDVDEAGDIDGTKVPW